MTNTADQGTNGPRASVFRTCVGLLLAALDSVNRSRVDWRQTLLGMLGHEPTPPAGGHDYSRFDLVAEVLADVLRMLFVGLYSGFAALLTLMSAPYIFQARLYGGVDRWCLRHVIGLRVSGYIAQLVLPLVCLVLARVFCRQFHRLRLSTYVLWPAELFWLVWLTFILCAPLCE